MEFRERNTVKKIENYVASFKNVLEQSETSPEGFVAVPKSEINMLLMLATQYAELCSSILDEKEKDEKAGRH